MGVNLIGKDLMEFIKQVTAGCYYLSALFMYFSFLFALHYKLLQFQVRIIEKEPLMSKLNCTPSQNR